MDFGDKYFSIVSRDSFCYSGLVAREKSFQVYFEKYRRTHSYSTYSNLFKLFAKTAKVQLDLKLA